MKPISLRSRLGLVAVGYGVVLAAAAMLVFARYMQYVTHPQDAAAAGGMYAGGDLILEIFIGCMFLVPTFFLALVVRESESLSIGYSKILLGLSLTLPICEGILSIPAVNQGMSIIAEISMARVFNSPIVLMALAGSRLLARFDRAKRFISYALAIEILTLVVMVAMLVLQARSHH